MSLSIDDLKEIFDRIIENLKNSERCEDYYNMELSIKKLAASNSNTPSELLEKLANDGSNLVRGYVACNDNTPPEVLVKLANDEYGNIRWMVAKNNPNTPKYIKTYLRYKNYLKCYG